MSRRFTIPPLTREKQGLASDPLASAWVSANAGSGKTHVLAQRVIRLLLRGAEPSRILCLTYTKAAAANMANRVFGTLAGWATLSDVELIAKIVEIENARPDAARLARARRLFAEALETPGGLKIQTIHAFCEAVLHQFPLEANIAGHFELLDGEMESALVTEARRELITGAAAGHDQPLAGAFADVLLLGRESGLDALLTSIISRREEIAAFVAEIGGHDPAFSALFAEYGFNGDETLDDIVGAIWPDAYFDRALATAIASRAAAAGKATAAGFADDLAQACQPIDTRHRLDRLFALFLTKKSGGVVEAKSPSRIMAKGVGDHFPDFADEFVRMAGLVREACDRAALLDMLKATRAALILADRLTAIYQRLKSARGLLDFNDLIARTAALLARDDAGQWVQYKLDRGIDHILLDEAQDTSPAQWAVIRALAEEFFAGRGAGEERGRSIFAVGDEKQSIYSFQGADPDAFDESRHDFERRAAAAKKRFEFVRLNQSFRSVDDVLRAVDAVFSREDIRQGVSRDPVFRHEALRDEQPGEVELWPLVAPEAVETPDDWTEAIDHARAPAVKLADAIAGTVKGWLASGMRLEGTGQPVRPGDVLVLVRKRDSFMHALSRALKNRNVPVAGADRLALSGHIAVRDLMALGRVLLQPEDDLSLAALLKSPLFGLDEDALMALAMGREGTASLGSALRHAAEADEGLRTVSNALDGWRTEASRLAPFDFYARLLGRDGGRERIIARLGHEASDVLDEFLSFCLATERLGLAGLEALVALLEEGGREIKREMDQTRGEVRIMTAHAAKGLEAPVVFLVDGGTAPFSHGHLPRLVPVRSKHGNWHGQGYLWRAAGAMENSVTRAAAADIRRRAEEEYRRLLYVAMTRAEDRLVICGYRGVKTPGDGIWHSIVATALGGAEHSTPFEHPALGPGALRFRASPELTTLRAMEEAAKPRQPEPMPAALSKQVSEPPVLPRPLTPSSVSVTVEPADPAPLSSPVLAPEPVGIGLERGLVVHRLLQVLPDMEGAHAGAVERHVAQACAGWSEPDRQALCEEILAVIADPAFRSLFSVPSRAEVGIMGTLEIAGRRRAVSAKLDRLFVGEAEVAILDYKTNRPAPANLAGVPVEHVAQLAIYAELVQAIYPGRRVRTLLLYSHAPRLIELPAERRAAALASLARA
jgi:ATP-dependent helicase/nuclease subunit A